MDKARSTTKTVTLCTGVLLLMENGKDKASCTGTTANSGTRAFLSREFERAKSTGAPGRRKLANGREAKANIAYRDAREANSIRETNSIRLSKKSIRLSINFLL